MEKLLLIAEKPSLMRELQSVYKNHRSEIPYNIDFTALSGHICRYANPKEYDKWDCKWDELTLPLIPDTWKINVIDDKKKMYKDISDMIKTNNYDGLINACDSDREGNAIFALLENKMKLKGKFYRLWVHDLTEKAILDAFKSMVDLKTDKFQKNLTEAAILRGHMDWLIGMNSTISSSLHSGVLMKIGRVKTPTLKIVYDNCMAIDNFKPTISYEVESLYKEGFSGVYADRFNSTNEANEFQKKLGSTATVKEIEKKTAKTTAPQLFKLSDIQIEANKAFGYSAANTLALVQSLYETHKLVSYPRCDCRYISTALAKDFKNLLEPIAVIPELTKFVNSITADDLEKVASNKKYVNDSEVDKSSHTALVGTTKKPDISKLSADELNILTMIYKRFLAIFLPPLVEDKTVIITDNNGYEFKSNGKVIKDKGFTALYERKSEDKILPNVNKGDVVHIDKFNINEKTTTPPQRLTEGSLVAEMENISKYIDDEELKDIMKESKGIGTPATRGAIITSLFKDGYMEKKKGKKAEGIYITELGKTYIKNLESFSIVSPILTAEWESKLKQVEQGELSKASFETDMINYVKTITKEMQTSKMNSYTKPAAEPICKCPKCGSDIIENSKAFSCSNKECGCVLFKEDKYFNSLGKKMTKTAAKALFEKGYVLAKNLKSKKGTTYDAFIYVKFDGKYPSYTMAFKKDDKNK